jgi:hypothetical protein
MSDSSFTVINNFHLLLTLYYNILQKASIILQNIGIVYYFEIVLILLMRGDIMEKKRIMLYVDDEMYEQIKELADKEKRSMNNYIVMLLEKELEAAST